MKTNQTSQKKEKTMYKYDQKGFGIVGVLLVLVVLGAIGGVGYYVFSSQKDNDSAASTASSDSTGSINQKPSSSYVDIKDLGVRIMDPDNRGLRYESEDISGPSEVETFHQIRDKNDAYFGKCRYPAGIVELSHDEAQFKLKIPGSYQATHTKQVGGKWYNITPGSNFQSPCAAQGSTDETYEDEIRLYIVNNLQAL